jgi:O-acetylhomoserine (thiol)-lyase
MHDETIAIHGGDQANRTRSVAVPIFQTVAHDFIDAEHANAIMDLSIPGFHYNRINNPTNDVLEKRMAALEGGPAAQPVEPTSPSRLIGSSLRCAQAGPR